MLPASRVIGHKEYGNTPPGGWKGRKSDPVYDMAWRRARVAAFTPRTTAAAQEDDDMPTPKEYADAVVSRLLEANQLTVGDTLLRLQEMLERLPQAVADYEVTSYQVDDQGKVAKRPAWWFWSVAAAAGVRSADEVVRLHGIVEGLLQKLGDGGQVDVEEFRTMLREELPKLDVTVRVDQPSSTVA